MKLVSLAALALAVALASAEQTFLRGEATNATSPALTCGGNCPSNNCPSYVRTTRVTDPRVTKYRVSSQESDSTPCPCGSATSYQDVGTWCAKFSGWSQSCCKCIMSRESGGNANAANHNSNGSFDVGLWQINDVNWKACSGGAAPCNPDTNLQCAIQVWKWGGNRFKLWSTCGACGCC